MNSVEIRKSSIQGTGVFAQKNFLAGDVVLNIDDSHVVTDQMTLTNEDWEFNCDFLDNGKIIRMQEPERSINHSCEPSTYVKTIDGVRKVIAMKNISEGGEITYDYAINGENEGTFSCHCGSKQCRKIYNGNFFKLPKDRQREYLPFLDDWFRNKHRVEIERL